jgi:hypothetical protein
VHLLRSFCYRADVGLPKADFMRYGTAKGIMSLSKENSTTLWNSVQDSQSPPTSFPFQPTNTSLRRLPELRQNLQHPPQPLHTTQTHPPPNLHSLDPFSHPLTSKLNLCTRQLQNRPNTHPTTNTSARSTNPRIRLESDITEFIPK